MYAMYQYDNFGNKNVYEGLIVRQQTKGALFVKGARAQKLG